MAVGDKLLNCRYNNGCALAIKMAFISAAVGWIESCGCGIPRRGPFGYQPSTKYCRNRAAVPAVMGVAIDVPDMYVNPSLNELAKPSDKAESLIGCQQSNSNQNIHARVK